MGLFDKLKEEGRGVTSAVPPAEGVDPLPADEVRKRLLAITGKGISAEEKDGEVVVAWQAMMSNSSFIGGGREVFYRAIQLTFDEDAHEAEGVCLSRTSDTSINFFHHETKTEDFDQGQFTGTEFEHVASWLGGQHETSGGADEKGYKFSWSDLREPVIEAVTGAGWTYRPKKV